MKVKKFKKIKASELYNKSLMKDTVRTVNKSKTRFFTIIAIVALGISVFSGFNSTSPDMLDTARKYYEKTNLSDYCVQSTIGLNADDIATLEKTDGISAVMPVYSVDGFLEIDGEQLCDLDGSAYTIRAIGFDVNEAYGFQNTGEGAEKYMNRLTLLEGSWPTATNECVVDNSKLSTPEQFTVGTTITITSDSTDLTNKLNTRTYTIVGIIRSPLYISYERGYTDVGTGKLGAFIYIPEECFTMDYYTAAYIKIEGSDNYSAYTDEYNSFAEDYYSVLQSIESLNLPERVSKMKKEYTKAVTEGQKQYDEMKALADSEIAEAKEQVENIKNLAENGDSLLTEMKKKYNEGAVDADLQVNMAKLEQTEQYKKWEESTEKYNQAKALVDEYADAETKYNNAKTTYDVAKNTVNTSLSTVTALENAVQTGQAAIDQVNQSQDDSKDNIITRLKSIAYDSDEINDMITEIKSLTAVGTAEEISAYMAPQIESLRTQLTASKTALQVANAALAKKEQELKEAEKLVTKLKQYKVVLAQCEKALDEAKKQLDDAETEIQLNQQDAVSQLLELKTEISNFEIQVSIAKDKVSTIDDEYSQKVQSIYTKLNEAQGSLEDGKKVLESLNDAKWIISDRDDSIQGYTEYYNTTERTSALAKVFPFAFFLVSAMVTLNTMSRMVDEDRILVGTYKAMGIENNHILLKYLFYSFAAAITGTVVGSLLGSWVFPFAICEAFSIMYDMPNVIMQYRVVYVIVGGAISTVSCGLVAWLSLRTNLTEDPSILMRTKVPKKGNTILLEKYPKLWSRLSFSSKVTFRNVFRNKKRVIMVMAGVAGCTALLVAGLGLSDSINSTFNKQFESENPVCKYDVQIALRTSVDEKENQNEAYQTVMARAQIEKCELMYMKTIRAKSDKKNKSMEINLVVPKDTKELSSYVSLDSAVQSGYYTLGEKGCLISDKLADELNIDVGEQIVLETGIKEIYVTVTGIVKNYVFHYVYMSPEAYKTLTGDSLRYNFITALFRNDITNEERNKLASDLIADNIASAVAFTSATKESLSYILNSLDYIVLVIVSVAILLAITVLYNLSNININERYKEIATLKVLGFNKSEVSSYISRENWILSVIGGLAGLVIGVPIHRLIISVAEVDAIRFGREMGVLSFVYAFALAMVFTFIVNMVMKLHLRKIDMVESLKSVE